MIKPDDIQKHVAEFFTSDPDFVLWCLDPERAQDSYWSNYTKRHPQDLVEFERAVSLVRRVGKNHPALPSGEKQILLDRILTDYYARRHFAAPSPRRNRTAFFAAAAVLVAGIVAVLFWTLDFADSGLPSAEAYENITLVTRDGSREVYDDIARISLTPKGKILIDGKENKENKTEKAGRGQNHREVHVHTSELVVPKGKRAHLQLSDGTRVWINSASVLRFPTTFGDTRDVFIEGEAYFEVAKDANRPFIVHTDHFATRVLGTSFDVTTAPRAGGSSAVVLVEGSVAIDVANGESVTLNPSERFSMKDGSYSVYEVDPYKYISWKDGLLFFTSNTLLEVLQKVAAFYKIEISCSGEIGGRKCTGKLILFDDLDGTLDVLSDIFRITYVRAADGSVVVKPAPDDFPDAAYR